MNFHECLRQDHRKIDSMIRRLEMTPVTAPHARGEYFEALNRTFALHAQAAADVLHGHVRFRGCLYDSIDRAVREQGFILWVLYQLERLPTDHDEWNLKLGELKEAIAAHVRDEEGPFGAMLSKVFSERELQLMAKQYLDRKAELGEEPEFFQATA